MKQSKEIIQFYRELDSWIKEGCPMHEIFIAGGGVCANLYGWAGDYFSYDFADDLEDEMVEQFRSQGLDINYPFGKEDYYKRIRPRNMYECPKRLAWIADRLKDAEEQEKEQTA